MSENNRSFDLGTILSITSKRVFTDERNIYDILEFLFGNEVYSHQMPRVMNITSTYILSFYPGLKGIGKKEIINDWQDVKAFITKQKETFGDNLVLSPMPKELCEYIDPIEEAIDICKNSR